MRLLTIVPIVCLLLAGCGNEPAPAASKAPPPGASAAPGAPPASAGDADHGAHVALGHLTLAGHELDVLRMGDVVPGKESAFEIGLVKGPAGSELGKLNVYLWVEDQGSTQASAPSKGTVENGRLHFHVTPRADTKPFRVIVRLRADGGIDERGGLPLDGHGHEHGASPHEGVVAAFKGPDGALAGHLELKLHDDKGDLELWLAKDAKISQPFDLPLDAVVRVTFIDVKGKVVELRVRNATKNEDEDGTANVRNGRTNYFIFPGETGADAKWLMGVKFASIVRLTFKVDGQDHASEEFMLVPHTHADGQGHK